jgi:hypothetical protein
VFLDSQFANGASGGEFKLELIYSHHDREWEPDPKFSAR